MRDRLRPTRFRIAAFTLFLGLLIFSTPSHAQEGSRKIRSRVDPVYPEIARSMNLSGAVRLSVTITPAGTVRNVKVLGGNPLLAEAASSAVMKWRFEPGAEETQVVVIQFSKH